MGLPLLLLVDDSDAVLEFEKAALGGHYALNTAVDGIDALEKIALHTPDAVLLDLSMPRMPGDVVLERLQADPGLRNIPVLVVSAERARGEKCLKMGAAGFLEKPLRADQLVLTVGQILEERRARERTSSLTVLFAQVGDLEIGLPLEGVRLVVDHPLTTALIGAPPHLSQYFELHGEPVLVLDLPNRLGVKHRNAVLDRKLIVVEREGRSVAASVDAVREPEEFSAAQFTPRDRLGGSIQDDLRLLVALVRTPRGHLPVIEIDAILNATLMEEVRRLASGITQPSAPSDG